MISMISRISRIFRIGFLVTVMVICLALAAYAAMPSLQIQSTKTGAKVEIERVIIDGKVMVSVTDAEKKSFLGLAATDFEVVMGGRTAKITSVQPLSENVDVPRHIVLILDNSDSMGMRNAVGALLAGLGEVLKTVRPIDDVQIVVFGGWKKKATMGGKTYRVQTFNSSHPEKLKAFAEKAYGEGMTAGTFLYEAMLAGLEIIRTMPDTEPRFMVVFSDGEDINSAYKRSDVQKAARRVKKFNAYAIDYMPGAKTDKFLTEFVSSNRGQIFKAASETNLVPIFQSVATEMQHYYIISYEFPLVGKLDVVPTGLNIEEIKTIDGSPLLGQIYFADGSSEIPSSYVRLTGPEQTAGFDEQKFRDTKEKYLQVLNIVGKRLADNSSVTLTLVGCNSDTGKEKANKKLSIQRAESVKNYLQAVWNIAPERISIEARNLPKIFSTKTKAEGQAENRRVEILTSDQAILAPVRSVYTETQIDAASLTVRPRVEGDIVRWAMTAANTKGNLAEMSGKGTPPAKLKVDLPTKDLMALAAGGDIAIKMELQGNKGQKLEMPATVKVSYLSTSQRLAQKQDLKVREKYALILFDFNKDTISGLNQVIVDKVADRIQKLPGANVEIVGHTDNIGTEAYNIKLSERRAQAVYNMLKAAFKEDLGDRIRYRGVGPKTPLYDNALPAGRAFNRTVTITLEYMNAE
jgi:outer membrane protein OmpA-like peptidoglycan-associated protein